MQRKGSTQTTLFGPNNNTYIAIQVAIATLKFSSTRLQVLQMQSSIWELKKFIEMCV